MTIELKAVVIDKPEGRRRVRYMVRIDGSPILVSKALNPRVKFDRENVLNSIAYDFNTRNTNIIAKDSLFKVHKQEKGKCQE